MKRRAKSSPPPSGKLFLDPRPAPPPASVHTAHIDGASRGNPGPASYAVIVYAPEGKTVLELGKYLGRETNNVAEYYALLAALDYATSRGIRHLRIRSDSELLVRQMQGRYKVKSAELRPLYEQAKKLARKLDYFSIEHVSREANRDADRLANEALSRTASSHQKTSAARLTAAKDEAETQVIRARYVNGVLVPKQPLNLPDGTEMTADLHIPKKT